MNKEQNIDKPLFSGKVAFMLYDTYGFPLDLTQILLREKNIEVDVEEFEREMKEQKERSKANWVGSGDTKQNELYLQLEGKTEFFGYEKNVINGKVLKLIKNNEFVESVNVDDEIEIITDCTVFYGESGGQVGDSGLIMLIGVDGVIPLPFSIIEVSNTIKTPSGVFIHKGVVSMGSFKINDNVNLTFDKERRNKIKANHSSAHLTQYALRTLFGENIMQKGSSVDENRMRFDFSYNKALTDLDVQEIETIVNGLIIKNTPVKVETMNIVEAKAKGAMALFGEKYGEEVSVVSMGECEFKNHKTINNKQNATTEDVFEALNNLNHLSREKDYQSIELCGGTHVKSTGDIGLFKIIKEESIASGIRRIEAITGLEALNYINKKFTIIDTLTNSFKTSSDEIISKIENLIKENKEFKKQIDNYEKEKINQIQFVEEKMKNIIFIHKILENLNPQDVKNGLLTWLNSKFKENFIIILICKNADKNTILVGVSKNICHKHNANIILQQIGAKGGGQPHFAMGSIEAFNHTNIENIKKDL